MSKKHKKLKKSGPFSPKKLRRWFFRLVLVGLGVGIGVLVKPSLIQDPAKRAQVEGVRDQLLEVNDVGQQKALELLNQGSVTAEQALGTASQITQDLTNQDPQELVTQTVTNLTEEVKTLPEKQVKKIKLEFCRDVIEEIELTCSQ